jgi:methionyl-tRNA formyltransferase
VKIAFCGLPLAALLLLHDGHEIVHASLCRKGAIGERRLRRALGGRVEIVPDLARDAVVSRIRAAKPDLLVSWFWTKKIPERVLQIAPLGAIGVHPSLLPRHRGPDPYFWALALGDETTGVTAHRLEEEYDTGAVLGRRELRIDASWNAWTLAKKLDRPSLALLREVVAGFARGAPPPDEPQDDALATEAPEPTDEDLEIRFGWDTDRILRLVRAAAPWPGAYTDIGGDTIVVTRARRAEGFPRALAPGEAAVQGGRAVVRTGDGAVELLEGRLEETDETLDFSALAEIVEKSRTRA